MVGTVTAVVTAVVGEMRVVVTGAVVGVVRVTGVVTGAVVGVVVTGAVVGVGDVTLGGGPAISRGSGVHATLTEFAIEAAEAEGIPYQLEASSGATHTDADAVSLTRAGVPSAVISVPNRYMHSPNEIVDLNDLEATAKLVAAIARRLDAVPPLT